MTFVHFKSVCWVCICFSGDDCLNMSIVPLAVDIAAVCCLAALLLHRYGNWRTQHVGVTLVVFIAWYFSFMIIFALPIDVSNVSSLI